MSQQRGTKAKAKKSLHARLTEALQGMGDSAESIGNLLDGKFHLTPEDVKRVRALGHEIDAWCEMYSELNR